MWLKKFLGNAVIVVHEAVEVCDAQAALGIPGGIGELGCGSSGLHHIFNKLPAQRAHHIAVLLKQHIRVDVGVACRAGVVNALKAGPHHLAHSVGAAERLAWDSFV